MLRVLAVAVLVLAFFGAEPAAAQNESEDPVPLETEDVQRVATVAAVLGLVAAFVYVARR